MSEQAATPVVPSFWVDAVEPLRDFYIEQLGFAHMMGVVGKDGNLEFAIVQREALMVMMGRPPQPLEGSSTDGGPDRLVELYLYVTDIDGYYEELRSRNVRIAEKIQTQWWGDRNFSVKDPYGYTLWFCQTVGQPEPPAGVTMI